ncbi:MAG TPA: histidine kinase [Gaiellaceae bacterium]|nr:histidine kinase [Gaiellaceae bacterium]
MRRIWRTLWPLARRFWFDALIVAAAVLGTLTYALRLDDVEPFPDWPRWLIALASLPITLPLLARRRYPFGAPAFIFLYLAAVSFADGDFVVYAFTTFLTVIACSFLFGLLEDRRQSLVGLALGIGAAQIVTYHDTTNDPADYVFVPVVFTVAWLVGFGLGSKFRQITSAEERAARAERERLEEARAAVAEERARIARELHDVVGHSVSVMTVQAAGVRRLLKPEQEREREALMIVEQTGREALAEMRRLVGVLRRPEEAPALAPQPSLEHLGRLVDQAREAGLPVELRIEGEPVELAAGLDLTAYRLVQEGLTNALKHARAEHAEVLVRYDDGHVELTVTDDGSGDGGGDSGGHGLVGMRERVSVYGGELQAGPLPEGGYRLRATLPLA